MCQVSFNIPEVVLANQRMDRATTEVFVRQMVAVAYYREKHETLDNCAEIARMSAGDFRALLSRMGVMTREEAMARLMDELEKGRRSGETDGYIPAERVRATLKARLAEKRL
ncbi:MAG: UPF0175 family protein [Clostridia bacterium]|nr:UPF0175 family protein [Clostridia bacterium]